MHTTFRFLTSFSTCASKSPTSLKDKDKKTEIYIYILNNGRFCYRVHSLFNLFKSESFLGNMLSKIKQTYSDLNYLARSIERKIFKKKRNHVNRERNRDLLSSKIKGRYGWGYHPYTLHVYVKLINRKKEPKRNLKIGVTTKWTYW